MINLNNARRVFTMPDYLFLQNVHLKVRGDQMNETTFNDFLKNVFNSAGDWDGGRLDRSKHKT